MNKAMQPILTRLAALTSPVHLAPGGARVIADIAHPNPLAALMRELNETILGRALLIESGGGASLALDVAGRRVLRLTDATGLPDADRCLAAATLEDDHKDDLLRLLQVVATPRHQLRVTSRQGAASGDGVSVGLPVALLADLLRIDLNDDPGAAPSSPPPEPRENLRAPAAEDLRDLARFAATIGPTLVAWLVRGGVRDGTADGPEEMLAPLHSFVADEAEALHEQLDRVSNVAGAPVCLVLGATLVEGHSVVCARVDGALLLGVIEGNATPALIAAWAAARA